MDWGSHALAQGVVTWSYVAGTELDWRLLAEQITAESGSSVLSIQADVIDAASLDAFFETVFSHHKKVDILVNNSGGPPSGPIESLTDIDYFNAFNLVFMSKVRASQYVLPSMKKQGWGRIINNESTSIKCALENMVLFQMLSGAQLLRHLQDIGYRK